MVAGKQKTDESTVEEAKPAAAASRRGRKSLAVVAQEEKPAEPAKRGRKSLAASSAVAATSASASVDKKPSAVAAKVDTYSYEDSDENAGGKTGVAESTAETGKKKRKSTNVHETSVAATTANAQVVEFKSIKF